MTKEDLKVFAKTAVPVIGAIGGGFLMYKLGYRKGVFDASDTIANWMRLSVTDKPDWLLKDFVEAEIDTGHLPYRY